MDFEKWYSSFIYLVQLGFDLDKNSARDLIEAANDFYKNYDKYVENISE